MTRWTPEQRQAAAQKRAEAKAPLLARAGLVQVETPKGSHEDYAADFSRRMADHEAASLRHIETSKAALREHCPDIFAEGEAGEARLRKYDLETAMILDHWTSLYRRAFGTAPPHLAHLQRALDGANDLLARERDGQVEQLTLVMP